VKALRKDAETNYSFLSQQLPYPGDAEQIYAAVAEHRIQFLGQIQIRV